MSILLATALCALAISAGTPSTVGQNPAGESSKLALQVSLELRRGEEWQSVDPKTVFHSGDAIRFRFVTSVGGYLYVLNQSSDGEAAWLFPLPQEGQRSRVEPGPEYLVPGTKGAFVVGGRAGFDVTYWVLSSAPIATSDLALPAPGSQPSTLEPRCRAETLRARGLCVDERAGPHAIARPEQAPLEALQGKSLVSRELKFQTTNDSTRISLASAYAGVIVYEFLIAHN
jgi:hypothetical protein